MRKYFILIIFIASQYIFGQQKHNSYVFSVFEESVKVFDYTQNDWKDWSKWSVKQFKIKLNENEIEFNNALGKFKILRKKSERIDKEGDNITEYSAVDMENERCDITLLKFNSKPGKYQIYIRYEKINIAYNLQIEE